LATPGSPNQEHVDVASDPGAVLELLGHAAEHAEDKGLLDIVHAVDLGA